MDKEESGYTQINVEFTNKLKSIYNLLEDANGYSNTQKLNLFLINLKT